MLGNPDCLGIVVRHATKYPIGSTAIAKVSCVSKAWRQASLPSPQPPIQNLVLDMIQALESASIEERGAECVACDSKPELSDKGRPAASCRCCGGLVRAVCAPPRHSLPRAAPTGLTPELHTGRFWGAGIPARG